MTTTTPGVSNKAKCVYERFFSPKTVPPIAVTDLEPADKALCMKGIPHTGTSKFPHWLHRFSPLKRPDIQCWARPLTPGGMFDDPLIDDSFSGDRQCTTESILTALSEMSRGLSGVFVIPEEDGWRFSNRSFAPLMWSVLVLLIDRGDNVRVLEAVRRGLPKNTQRLAGAVVARAHQLLERALQNARPEGFTIEQLDERTMASGLKWQCASIVFPVEGQLIMLRPSAAKALASVLMACTAWTPETLPHAPLAMLSALAALESPGVACLYGARAAARMLAMVQSQTRCPIGPPSDQPMEGRMHELAAQTLQLFAMGRSLSLVSSADFSAAVAARAMIWADDVSVYALRNLMTDVTTPSVWRAAAYADTLTAITTTRLDRYPVPLGLVSDLDHRLRLLRAHYGRPGVSNEMLLSCSPLGMRHKAGQATLVPPITPAQVWRRMWPTRFAMPSPVMINATADDVEEFMAAQAPLVQQQRVPLDMLMSNAPRAVSRVLVYACGDDTANRFGAAVTAFRLMAIPYGDRLWNDPRNFVISSDAVLVNACAARPMMLRSLMARVYGRRDVPVHVPFLTLIVARELHTLSEIGDPQLAAETASAVCDLLVTMMRLDPPPGGISSARTLMTYQDLKIRLAGAEQPWPVMLCTGFIPLFLGGVTEKYFERGFLVSSPVLYNGYLNTLLAMLRSPLDENVGFWHWPTDVLEAILRYFFLIYMQQQGLLVDASPVPGIMSNNRPLVQALAYLYVHRKLERADVARILMPDSDDAGIDGDGVDHFQYYQRGGGGDDEHGGGDARPAVRPRGFAKRARARLHPNLPRNFSWKELKRADDHLLERGALELFPLQHNSISQDLAEMTADYRKSSSLPSSIPPGGYSSLQFKQTTRDAVRGNRHSVRSIVRLVGYIASTLTPVEDLARGIVSVSGTTQDVDSYQPRTKGGGKRAKSPVVSAAGASKKSTKKRTAAVHGDDDDDDDKFSDEYQYFSIPDANNTDLNGDVDDGADDEDGLFLDPSHPIHKRVARGRHRAAQLQSDAAKAKKAAASSSSSSSAAAKKDRVDMFSSSSQVAQHRRTHDRKKRVTALSPAMAEQRERVAKLRTERSKNLHYVGACLSRFVVVAVTAVATTSSSLPVSFVRAVLGTSYTPYGPGGRAISWENSPHNTRNRLSDLTTSLTAVKKHQHSIALSQLYPLSQTPVQTSAVTDHVITSLFGVEIAPWVSRGSLEKHANDLPMLFNQVPGVRALPEYREWDLPYSSTAARDQGEAGTPCYAYSMQLEVDSVRVRDAMNPTAVFSSSSERTREQQQQDAPYDFDMSLWMCRTLPRDPPTTPAYDATGVELVAAVSGSMQSYLNRKNT